MSGKNTLTYIISRNRIRAKNLWVSVIDAVSGKENDFTRIPVRKAIFLLSLPMILEMFMEAVFAVVDIFFVSKLGADAVAMVGITESLMTIVYAIGIGIGTGTTALIARRIGEGKLKEASLSGFQAILLSLFISILISIPGIIYAEEILRFMGTSEVVASKAYQYTAIMLGSNTVIMFLFVINAIFRSSGDAAMSMRVLWMANIINIILDPCLIFGLGPFPELGLKGAAIATTIGRGLAVVFQFFILINGKRRIKLTFSQIAINIQIVLKLIKLSIGGIGQALIATSSWIGLMRIMAEFGNEVLAGYTIAIRIIVFSLLPAWGLGNAASTLTGQNLGALKPDRAERSVWLASFINIAIMAFFSLFFIAFPETFIRIFINDPIVISHGVTALKLMSIGLISYGFGMVIIQAFNGAGDTITPTIINLVCFWVIEIPLAYLLAVIFQFSQMGIYFAILFSETLMTVIGLYFFLKGKWKKHII